VISALEGNPLMSPWANEKLQRVGRDEYSAQYPLSLALKDVNLALLELDIDRFAVANSLAAQWQRAVEHGLGNEDLMVIARASQR
jgi:3-hydroxyisobutyrate dehydrogenase